MHARTLHIHQCADVSASHRVEHLAGHRVGEIRVVHRHLQTVPFGLGDGDATFRPPIGAETEDILSLKMMVKMRLELFYSIGMFLF